MLGNIVRALIELRPNGYLKVYGGAATKREPTTVFLQHDGKTIAVQIYVMEAKCDVPNESVQRK